MSPTFTLSNGDLVRDQITGFEGHVTGRADYITGCNTYLVQPMGVNSNGAVIDSRWFDQDRLTLITAGSLKLNNSKVGGDKSAPAK